MDMVNTRKTQTNTSITKEKVMSTVKKVLLYTLGIIGGLFLLCVIYQIFKFLFVGAILLIGFLAPRRWWW